MEIILAILTIALFFFAGLVFYRERQSIKSEQPPADDLQPFAAPELSAANLDSLQDHRIALQNFQSKLLEKEQRVNSKLQEKERLIEENEKESIARIRKASEDLERYSKALYETEFRIIDYVKRAEKKELAVFEEIRQNAAKYEQYNSDPSKDGFMFESTVAELMKKNGFQRVLVTQQSNDYGADVTAEKDGVKYVVQCKYYQSAVGIEAVQQIYSAKVHYGSHVAVVATNSVFTHAAKVLAEETGVLLWDCEKLASMEEVK